MSWAGCNYVLHSSGQIFSHKRKHERNLLEYGVPCKQPKLISSGVTAPTAIAASGSDDIRIVSHSPSTTTMTSLDGVQPSVSQSAVSVCEPTESTTLCAATTSTLQSVSVSTQPPVSTLPAVSTPNVSQSISNTSFSVPPSDPTASSSTTAVVRHTDDIDESTKQDAAASTAVLSSAQPEMDTSAVRRSPVVITVDDDDLPVATTSPAQVPQISLPVNVVERSGQSKEMPVHPDEMKLEKLEKKEYVDLEDLAEMTKLKQIAAEKKTGLESPQDVVAFSSISSMSLTHCVTTANSVSAASSSAPSLVPAKSLTTTKSSRSTNEKKERDESWQKCLKRSVVSLSETLNIYR